MEVGGKLGWGSANGRRVVSEETGDVQPGGEKRSVGTCERGADGDGGGDRIEGEGEPKVVAARGEDAGGA